MKNLFAKVAKEYKQIMKHYQHHAKFKSQVPKDVKDFEDLMRLRKGKKG